MISSKLNKLIRLAIITTLVWGFGVISVPEQAGAVNSSSPVMTGHLPDLTVSKTSDDNAESLQTGAAWNWTLAISNSSTVDAIFPAGSNILLDTFPAGPAYTDPGTVALSAGSMDCTFTGNVLACITVVGGIISGNGTINVVVPTTASTAGTFVNNSADCQVDPPDDVAEDNETNNNCTATDVVNVTGADLSVTKTNDVGGTFDFDLDSPSWTWTITLSNTGTEDAVFNNSAPVFRDLLPNANVIYGTPVISTGTNTTGTLVCGYFNGGYDLFCDASGTFTFGTPSSITVSIPVTPTDIGTFDNPRTADTCHIDPSGFVTEDDETNNTCSDSVVVTGPDLTASKTNSEDPNDALLGVPFTWTVTIENIGNSDATFAASDTILLDALLDTNITYNSIIVANKTDIAGTGTIVCSLDGFFNLTCGASGGTVIIGANTGSFDVEISVTPTGVGDYINPRNTNLGVCLVDPRGEITEIDGLAGSNNRCSDTVTVIGPNFTATKTNDVNGRPTLNVPFTWTITVENIGTGAGDFPDNSVIFLDNLPDTDISYGTVTVTNLADVAGGIVDCGIDVNFDLICTATVSDVYLAATGSFDIEIETTLTAEGTFDNPRLAGNCAVDPDDDVLESDDTDNSCADTVRIKNPSAPAASSGEVAVSDPAISKSGSPLNATIGEEVVWTIWVTNPGSTPTNFVFVNDPIPAMFDIVDVTTTQGTASVAGQVVTVDVGTVQPGQTITIQIFTVANDLAQPGEVCNTATITGGEATACVNIFPSELPPTGGQPMLNLWLILTGITVAVGLGGIGFALKQKLV